MAILVFLGSREFLEWFSSIFFLILIFGAEFYYILNQFLRVRPKWWARAAVVLIGGFSFGTIIYIADAFNILFLLPFFVAVVWTCTRGSPYAKASLILILYPMIMAVNAIWDNYLLVFSRNGRDGACAPALRVGFWLLVCLLARRFIPDREDGQPPLLSPRMWALTDLLALTPGAAVFTLVIFPQFDPYDDAKRFRAMAIYILPFIVVSSVSLLYAVTVLSRHEALRRKETLWELQRIYDQNLAQEQTQVRRLRHDMANHLQALAGLMDEPEKARAYLESLLEMPGLTVSRRFCEHPTVNTVLAGKVAIMEEKAIRGDINVTLPKTLPVPDTDLCALFANALDNAIEACEKLDAAEDRVIWVRARADKGLLMAQITNRTNRAAPASLQTTKADKRQHGYGLSILQEIASRAGGTCEIEQRPGVFELLLTIPIL